MDIFKRLNKDSKIDIYDMSISTEREIIEKIQTLEQNNLILQFGVNALDKYILIEYLPNKEKLVDTPYKWQTADMEFENALDTIINKDPFGAKYSGKAIREIFESGDRQWLDMALQKMHNTFIVDKLKYILECGGHGKILC